MKQTANPSSNALYVFEVFLINGPVTEEFIEANPSVSRKIEIKGSQTLADLHKILFKAFDRKEEHLYEFQVGGERPNDPSAKRYGLQSPFAGLSSDDDLAGEVSTTTIASLGLAVDDVFGYWFDFGDDWWHQVDVLEIKGKAGIRKSLNALAPAHRSMPILTRSCLKGVDGEWGRVRSH